jgi:hypothetical protein
MFNYFKSKAYDCISFCYENPIVVICGGTIIILTGVGLAMYCGKIPTPTWFNSNQTVNPTPVSPINKINTDNLNVVNPQVSETPLDVTNLIPNIDLIAAHHQLHVETYQTMTKHVLRGIKDAVDKTAIMANPRPFQQLNEKVTLSAEKLNEFLDRGPLPERYIELEKKVDVLSRMVEVLFNWTQAILSGKRAVDQHAVQTPIKTPTFDLLLDPVQAPLTTRVNMLTKRVNDCVTSLQERGLRPPQPTGVGALHNILEQEAFNFIGVLGVFNAFQVLGGFLCLICFAYQLKRHFEFFR